MVKIIMINRHFLVIYDNHHVHYYYRWTQKYVSTAVCLVDNHCTVEEGDGEGSS